MINPRSQDPEFLRFRGMIAEQINRDSLGLEIGPFDRPIFTKDEFNVEYIDYRSTDDAKSYAAAAPGHDPQFVPDIDYVVPSSGDWGLVDDNRYDWIISSYALEHCPSLVDFILTIGTKLKPGGLLISWLPDKRRMFDVYRPISTLGTVMDDHLRSAKVCRPQAVFDQIFYARLMSIDAADRTYGANKDHLPPEGDFQHALAEARRASAGYVDAHNYVFTSASFEHIAALLCANHVVPFDPVLHIHPEAGEMSFASVVRKI